MTPLCSLTVVRRALALKLQQYCRRDEQVHETRQIMKPIHKGPPAADERRQNVEAGSRNLNLRDLDIRPDPTLRTPA